MGKLVRDGIPDLIEQSGRKPRFFTLGKREFEGALHKKLAEEAGELRTAGTRGEVLDEAADVLEVLAAIVAMHGFGLDAVVARARAKHSDRGGFTRRLWLESVDPGH